MDNALLEYLRTVFNTLARIIEDKNSKMEEGKEFLLAQFNQDQNLFCQFIGFAHVEGEVSPLPKSVLVGMFVEIAMAGLTIAWRNGKESSERFRKAVPEGKLTP